MSACPNYRRVRSNGKEKCTEPGQYKSKPCPCDGEAEKCPTTAEHKKALENPRLKLDLDKLHETGGVITEGYETFCVYDFGPKPKCTISMYTYRWGHVDLTIEDGIVKIGVEGNKPVLIGTVAYCHIVDKGDSVGYEKMVSFVHPETQMQFMVNVGHENEFGNKNLTISLVRKGVTACLHSQGR